VKPDQLIPALEEGAQRLGITVKYEALAQSGISGSGGLCKVRGEWWLIVEKKATPSERVAILVDALAGFDTESLALPEKIEELLARRRIAKAQSQVPSSAS
jgi:hypothetical protein